MLLLFILGEVFKSMQVSKINDANLNYEKSRIINVAYVGNFLNHGFALAQYGSGLIYFLSKIDFISKIDIICPYKNNKYDMDLNIQKVNILETYDYKKPLTMLRIIRKIYLHKYDLIIFNMNSTSFGEGNLSNFLGLIAPLILKKIFKKNVVVIYHSSVLTNDVEKLGYNSLYDKLRKAVLKYIETSIFKKVNTFVTLQLYKNIIDKKIKKNRVNAIKIEYIEAIPTLLLNGMEEKSIELQYNKDIPRILLYGYWGPQKDLEFALNTLNELKKEGYNFNLVISGGINNHFKDYQKKYNELIEKYKSIINELKGYVEEKDILDIFKTADLLLLPYSASGGWSGVLSQAIFFEISVIGIEFPEYIEEAKGYENVILVKREDFKNAIRDFLDNFKNGRSKTINVKEKIEKSIKYLNEIIKSIE